MCVASFATAWTVGLRGRTGGGCTQAADACAATASCSRRHTGLPQCPQAAAACPRRTYDDAAWPGDAYECSAVDGLLMNFEAETRRRDVVALRAAIRDGSPATAQP